AGLAPLPARKPKPDDLRARTAVPLCLVASSAPPGEILGEVSLADLAPSALAHLGMDARRAWQLDGRALALASPPAFGVNLIVNGGAEAQLGWSAGGSPLITGWRELAPFRVARHDPSATALPTLGQSYFEGQADDLARQEQTIDLRALAGDVDRGVVRFRLAGRLGTRRQSPASIECAVEFLSEQRKALERAVLGPVGPDARRAGAEKGAAREGLIELDATGRVPRRARAARVILLATGPGAE